MSLSFDSLGIYIHVPFCERKCNYCDFYSYKADNAQMDEYTRILKSQLIRWGKRLTDKEVDTIYFGGGTPSLLGTARLVEILEVAFKAFRIASDCEITLEANPSSGRLIDFSVLKNSGFNRVSLGMQSANDNELRILGRCHTTYDVIKTVKEIRESGISNYSLDVMLGIPLQTEDSLAQSLDLCYKLNASHVSTYMLSVEPATEFGRNADKYNFADDDTQADLFRFTSEYLKDLGYCHYEISNFCKNGLKSRHNMRYWQLKDYLGLGPSAHSLINGKRFYYPKSMERFSNNEFVDDGIGNTKEEYIMLSLRTDEGINVDNYITNYGERFSEPFYKKVALFEKSGYIKNDGNSIRLTEEGFLVSNAIIAELI